MRFLTAAATLSLVLITGVSSAKDFYVDPVTGSDTADGSAATPWKSLQAVFDGNKIESQHWTALPYVATSVLGPRNAGAPVKAGDTLYLRNGFHGALSITGYYNKTPITIAAAPGATPKLEKVLVRSASHWKIAGLDVSLEHAATFTRATMIVVENHGHSGPSFDIVIDDCSVRTVADTSGWTAADWDGKSANGIQTNGARVTLRRNRVVNANFGIAASGKQSLVEYNVVDTFAGDGMRGLGDDSTFQYNVVKNALQVNDNHSDGFQSWSLGSDGSVGTGVVRNMTLRGNLFVNYEEPRHPLASSMQGIGCFDGMFEDWVVENNVIITDHWHGISLYGAKNVRVVNNTLIDPNTASPGPPWIKITAHKNGAAPVGCVVRNNVTTALASDATGVVEDNNLVIKTADYAAHFVDAAKYDLHLLPTSTARDKGSTDLAPALDIDGVARPQGSAIDLGAYEWHEPGVMPVDGGLGESGTPIDDAGGTTGGDTGPGPIRSDAGAGNDLASTDESGGCGCRTTVRASSAGVSAALPSAALAGLAALLRRRRVRGEGGAAVRVTRG